MSFAVSILVVSYNTRDLTLRCLRSIHDQTRSPFEVIVFDNNSIDGSAEAIEQAFPGVKLIRAGRNDGFAKGNNIAAKLATGTYLLLLNSDTEVLDNAIDRMLVFAGRHPEALIGGRTSFADGSINYSSCHSRPTLWSVASMGMGLATTFRHSSLCNPEGWGSWQRMDACETDCITGCFLLIRRELWENLRGFDESFFMYGEDTDLCIRARSSGAQCLVCSAARIIHHGGASEKVRADKMVKLFVAKAQLFHKHWSRPAAGFGVRMLDLWALTRVLAHAALAVLRPSSRASRATWWQVWQRRDQWRRVGKNFVAATPPMPEPAAEGATL